MRTILPLILLPSLASLHAAENNEDRFAAMTQTEIRAYELDVMRRIADLALVTPKLNTSPLPDYDYDRLDYGMTIGIERTPRGRLWACWVAGGDSPKAYFVLATSDDDGETWSKPRLVVDSHSQNCRWTGVSSSATCGPTRSVACGCSSISRWTCSTVAPECGRPSAIDPDADQPVVVGTSPHLAWRHAQQAHRAFQRRMDVAHLTRPARGFGPFEGACSGNWTRIAARMCSCPLTRARLGSGAGECRFPDPDWHEHMIVERKDGTLWMLARTAKGIMQTTSADSGRTWAVPTEPTGIRHPNARFHLRRLASDAAAVGETRRRGGCAPGSRETQRVAFGGRWQNLARRSHPRRAHRRLVPRRLPSTRRHDLHLLRSQPRHRWRNLAGPLY